MNWGGSLANFSLSHLFLELGMQYSTPFVQEVYVGSPYLNRLNGDGGWEAANVPSRVGIVNTASEYWRGGPFRLKNPDYAGEFSILTSTAAAGLDYWAFQGHCGCRSARPRRAVVRARPARRGVLPVELRRVLVPGDLRRSADLVGLLPAERRLHPGLEPVLLRGGHARSQWRAGAHAGDASAGRLHLRLADQLHARAGARQRGA